MNTSEFYYQDQLTHCIHFNRILDKKVDLVSKENDRISQRYNTQLGVFSSIARKNQILERTIELQDELIKQLQEEIKTIKTYVGL